MSAPTANDRPLKVFQCDGQTVVAYDAEDARLVWALHNGYTSIDACREATVVEQASSNEPQHGDAGAAAPDALQLIRRALGQWKANLSGGGVTVHGDSAVETLEAAIAAIEAERAEQEKALEAAKGEGLLRRGKTIERLTEELAAEKRAHAETMRMKRHGEEVAFSAAVVHQKELTSLTERLATVERERDAARRFAASVLAKTGPLRCPTCDSPDPKRHPCMGYEGEVQPCADPWHRAAGDLPTDGQSATNPVAYESADDSHGSRTWRYRSAPIATVSVHGPSGPYLARAAEGGIGHYPSAEAAAEHVRAELRRDGFDVRPAEPKVPCPCPESGKAVAGG